MQTTLTLLCFTLPTGAVDFSTSLADVARLRWRPKRRLLESCRNTVGGRLLEMASNRLELAQNSS